MGFPGVNKPKRDFKLGSMIFFVGVLYTPSEFITLGNSSKMRLLALKKTIETSIYYDCSDQHGSLFIYVHYT